MKTVPRVLPEFFRPLMWSYQFEKIDPQNHKKLIITQAINYGALAHWRWIVGTYGKEEVRHILQEVPVTSLRRHVIRLVSLLFKISAKEFNYASRGSH